MRVRRMLLLAGLLVLPLRAALAADTLHVPQQFATIQAAVDASANGDTILIKGGVYPEAVAVFSKIELTLRGKGKVILAPVAGTALTLTLCTECTVDGIGVGAPASVGIKLVSSADTRVIRCRIADTTGDGIHVQTCGSLTIESCTVTNAGHDAIALGESAAAPANTCLVLRDKLAGAANDGVSVAGSGNSIVGNVVTGAGFAAFHVLDATDSANNVFTGNKALQPALGFDLNGDDNVVSGNTVVHSSDDAILIVAGSGHFISGNKLIAPGTSGVFANSGIPGVVLGKNTITNSNGTGMHLICDGLILEANVVKGSGADGIACFGDAALVTGNTLSGNAADGLSLLGDGGLCVGNTVAGNAGDGIDVSGDDHVLSGNTGKGNGLFDLRNTGVGNTADGSNSFKTVGP